MKEVKHFRDNLSWFLEEFGISQRVFAERVGISYPNLNRILKGHAVPGLDTCETIASACSQSIDQPRFRVLVTWLLEPPTAFKAHFEEILQVVT